MNYQIQGLSIHAEEHGGWGAARIIVGSHDQIGSEGERGIGKWFRNHVLRPKH